MFTIVCSLLFPEISTKYPWFSGYGYMKFPPLHQLLSNSPQLNITIVFRPVDEDGLILFSGDETLLQQQQQGQQGRQQQGQQRQQQDFFGVSLVGGKVEFRSGRTS